jgi:hypothetical protein
LGLTAPAIAGETTSTIFLLFSMFFNFAWRDQADWPIRDPAPHPEYHEECHEGAITRVGSIADKAAGA